MKNISFKKAMLLAAVSGVITGLTFPTMFGGVMLPNLGFLAWFSLVPLFAAINGAGLRRAFGLSFITGFIYHAVALYWIYNALTRYGKVPLPAAIIILFLMMVVMGAYVALGPAWVGWFRSKWGGPALVLLPVAWVALELARNCFPFGGFPWCSLAYSQSGYPALIQTADIFSIFGLTFLIVMVNQLIAELIYPVCSCGNRCEDGTMRQAPVVRLAKIVPVIVLVAITLAYGWYRLETTTIRSPAVRTARIALVQGNIPQDEQWDPELLSSNLDIYKEYMELIKESRIDLAVWPESAYPYPVSLLDNSVGAGPLGLNPEDEDAPWLLFGALSSDDEVPKTTLYNSAILVDNAGNIIDRYHKSHLVPFAEYVPIRKALFFINKLVGPAGDFAKGGGLRPLFVRGGFKVGPLICFEDIFPDISREMVVGGANILVNLTNDAWHGWTSAAYQHLAIARFRSVENRRYMLRATNTGVTAVIDPAGGIELESDLFNRSFAVSNIPIMTGFTMYDKIGDLFAYICAVIVLALTIVVMGREISRVVKDAVRSSEKRG